MDRSRIGRELSDLAAHLATRRSAILEAWRRAVGADPGLATASMLSRTQFHDHIPEVLEAFEQRLCASDGEDRREAAAQSREGSAGHGLHRWHQGYDQRQVMYEWRHLQLVLVDELEAHAGAARRDPAAMAIARRSLADVCSEGVCESASQYARLQQAEAAGRLQDLERAVAALRQAEQARAEALREAAHDLRGNLGVVRNVAAVLERADNDPGHATYLHLLSHGVASLHALLDDLMDLSRLEAGHEQRNVAPLDVTPLLAELCDSLQALAAGCGLYLRAEGPPELPIEGDRTKIRRIAQNLLLNAIKYTARGGVRVSWEPAGTAESPRWVLSVQDSGPGFEDGAKSPLAQAIAESTREARAVETSAPPAAEAAPAEPAPLLPSRSRHRPLDDPPGEGIGLAIVKRLCELLDAPVELITAPGKGSTFRVSFPARYPPR